MSSVSAVELRNRLSVATALELPATLIFDHPSVTAVAERIEHDLYNEGLPVEAAALIQIDSLETTLMTLASDDLARKGIAARLSTLLSKLSADRDGSGDVDVESATDEELFKVLDDEATDPL
jgi:phosphopantetheine binding protein